MFVSTYAKRLENVRCLPDSLRLYLYLKNIAYGRCLTYQPHTLPMGQPLSNRIDNKQNTSRFKRLVVIHTLVFLISYLSAQSQDPPSRHYTVNDGLPSSEVYCSLQDSKGYMWFGTDRGVARFDGYKFKVFTTADGLSDNTVFNIYESENGTLFFRTYNGVICKYRNDIFSTITTNRYEYSNATTASSDSQDNYWFSKRDQAGESDFCYIDKNKNEKIVRKHYPSDISYLHIYEISKNNFISILAYGVENDMKKINSSINYLVIYRYYGDSLIFRLKDSAINSSFNNTFIYSIIRPKKDDDSYLISIGKYILNIGKDNKISYINNINPGPIYADRQGRIWVSGYNAGVALLDSALISSKVYFSGKTITSIFQDSEFGYWFSTIDDGVYYIPNLNRKTLFPPSLQGTKKIKNICIAREKPHTSLFAADQSGALYKIVGKTITPQFYKSKQLLNSRPSSILKLGENKIIYSNSIGTFEVTNKSITPFLPMGNLYSLLRDSATESLTINSGVLYRYNSRSNNLTKIKTNVKTRLFCLAEYQKNIYVGSMMGLLLFRKNKLTLFDKNNPLLVKRITDIKTSRNNLWIATRGVGIILKTDEKLTQISENKGLISNMCNNIFIANDQSIWVSTNKGISWIKYNEGHYTIRNITVADGLSSNEVNQVVVVDDTVWAATNNGISYFTKSSLLPINVETPIHFTRLQVNGKIAPIQENLDLAYDQNTLVFNYVGISFKNAGKVQYKYQLLGIDTGWNYTEQTILQYNYLAPGRYTLTIHSKNINGAWSKSAASISFHINPPFWQTWWFFAFIFLVVIDVTVVIFRLIKKRKKNVEKLNHDLSRAEQLLLSAQIEPHFIFNSLNSIHNYILAEDKRFASKYLTNFAKLMRGVLIQSQQTTIPVKSELETLNAYLELESLRFKNKFSYTIDVDEELLTSDTVLLPSLLLQPFIENAVLHGLVPHKEKGCLFVRFWMTDNVLNCTIRDTGVGINNSKIKSEKENKEHKSVGMTLTKRRIDLMNMLVKNKATLSVSQVPREEGGGTLIELSFPQNT